MFRHFYMQWMYFVCRLCTKACRSPFWKRRPQGYRALSPTVYRRIVFKRRVHGSFRFPHRLLSGRRLFWRKVRCSAPRRLYYKALTFVKTHVCSLRIICKRMPKEGGKPHMVLLTVFTPTYNRAHTLPEAYCSLKAQTSKNFLWLIVDDGSTDRTAALGPPPGCRRRKHLPSVTYTVQTAACTLRTTPLMRTSRPS